MDTKSPDTIAERMAAAGRQFYAEQQNSDIQTRCAADALAWYMEWVTGATPAHELCEHVPGELQRLVDLSHGLADGLRVRNVTPEELTNTTPLGHDVSDKNALHWVVAKTLRGFGESISQPNDITLMQELTESARILKQRVEQVCGEQASTRPTSN